MPEQAQACSTNIISLLLLSIYYHFIALFTQLAIGDNRKHQLHFIRLILILNLYTNRKQYSFLSFVYISLTRVKGFINKTYILNTLTIEMMQSYWAVCSISVKKKKKKHLYEIMQIVTGLLFIKELPNLINNSIRVCKVIKVSSYRLINRLI